MHTTDDRGFHVRVIPVYKLLLPKAMGTSVPWDARMSILRQLGSPFSRAHTRLLIIGLLFVAGVMLTATFLAWYMRLSVHAIPMSLPVCITAAAIGLLCSLVYAHSMLMRERAAVLISRHGYCASCGYSLAGLDPEADRCIVCPECQSAWRVFVRFGWKHPSEL